MTASKSKRFQLVKLIFSFFLCPSAYNAFQHDRYHCTTRPSVAEGLLCYDDDIKMSFVHCLVGYCKDMITSNFLLKVECFSINR